jgi:hypothetical protein
MLKHQPSFKLGKTPSDLAAAVHSELRKRTSKVPAVGVLTALFECLYFASFRTEEAQPIKIYVAYVNPDNPDPSPPPNPRPDRWMYTPFREAVPMTVSNVVKIAKASDPRSSSFAVHPDKAGDLKVWGLIDQGNRYHDYVNYESNSGPDRPGIFQASIEGIGHIATYIDYEKVAELKINTVVRNSLDVLRADPVSEKLEDGLLGYLASVEKTIAESLRPTFLEWEGGLRDEWVSTICRLLLRVQNYRHGGAILITGDASFSELKIKHRIEYPRLPRALAKRAKLMIEGSHTTDVIFRDYMEKDADEIPIDLYFDEPIGTTEFEDANSEVEGTIWFVSLLTRVDGLVLMNPSLDVKGFGVEITTSDAPTSIFVARNRHAKDKHLRGLDYDNFGTRHRSMMRYCAKVPNSIGFVVSQDGDVRVITEVRGKVVVWENVRLQLHDFVRRTRLPRKLVSGND